MVKKFKKIPNIKIYSVDSELEGHIFGYGRIGAGKSVSIKSILEGYKDNRGYKIFDLYGGERYEGIYWTIPNQDDWFWKKLRVLGQFNEEGPKQYKVNLLYPYFDTKLPKKLPKKVINGEIIVNSKVFTIPLKDIESKDLRMIIGNLSDTNKYAWDSISYAAKKVDGSGALNHLSKQYKAMNTLVYKNFIIQMIREKFLADNGCDYNLDLASEAKNQDVITILCLEFVPEKFHLFILNYIINKLTSLIDINKIKKKNIIFIREASAFFKATDDSVLEDRFKIFRTNMNDYIRMGRRGMYFALDCQSPFEVKGLVQGSEDYLLMFKTTSWRDKEEMCTELKKENRMRNDQIAALAFLEKGQAYIAETGKVVHKVQIALPRTMYWKKEYPNFYKRLWESCGGEWLNISNIKEEIREKFKEDEKRYKELEKKPKKDIEEVQIKQNINMPQQLEMIPNA